MAESDGIEVHRHDFLLGIIVLQLGGRNPFLELAQHQFRGTQVLATRKQVFGQLLCNSGAAAFFATRQHAESYAEQSPFVYTRVFCKALILNTYQGFRHVM